MLTLIALSSSSFAFETRCSWPGDSTTLVYQVADFPDHIDLLNEVSDAMNKVNANPSRASISLGVALDNNQTFGNGRNDLIFAPCSSGAISCVVPSSSGGDCVEMDLFVDPDFDWTLTRAIEDNPEYENGANSGDYRPLLSTGIHELLHVLGLKHENEVSNVMGNAWSVVSTNDGITRAYVTEDSAAGLIDLYGKRSDSFEDLALMHFKRDAARSSGEYSKHMRTEVLQGNGSAPVRVPNTDEPVYEVDRGTAYDFEVTIENVGKSFQTTDVCYFLSSNDNITSSDTLLHTATVSVGVNDPYLRTQSLTIPWTTLPNQSYWIGARVDCAKSLSEHREKNNTVYIAEIIPQ